MDEATSKRSSKGVAILAVLAVAGSAVGVMLYQLAQKEKPTAETTGFDISKTEESKPVQDAAQAPPGSAAQGDRTMFQAEDLGKMRFGEGGSAPKSGVSAQKAPDNFTEACRKMENKVQALAFAYTKRYPSIARYGKDWMSYPDLRKLDQDYLSNHDPVAFMRGAAQSKNFAALLAKYATDPALKSFVMDGIKQAPGELTASAMALLKEDNAIKTVVANVATALGLPPAATAGILGGGQVDQNQVMGQIMQGTPGLQGAMQQQGTPSH
jgi:hypothetical protein